MATAGKIPPHTQIQTCKHPMAHQPSPPPTHTQTAATAKAEHLVITIRLVQNMLCRLASQT